MNEFISVIVPVYNAEKHIDECLQSIADQDYKNMEIIVVDDGSIDHSPEICDRFAALDSRFRIIHKSNGGVSSARNTGIENAKGIFLVFADSDDRLIPGYISKAVRCMVEDNTEYFSGAFQILRDGELKAKIDYLGEFGKTVLVEDYLLRMADYHTEAFWGANWAKMYRAEIIKQNGIKFESGVQLAEDFRFNLNYLKYVSNISISHLPVYAYRVDTENSISKQHRDVERYWKEYFELYLRYRDTFHAQGLDVVCKEKIDAFLIRACNSVLRYHASFRAKNIKQFSKLLKAMNQVPEVQEAQNGKIKMNGRLRASCIGMKTGKLYLLILVLLNTLQILRGKRK